MALYRTLAEAETKLYQLLRADTDAADQELYHLLNSRRVFPNVQLEFLSQLAEAADRNDFVWRILQHPQLDMDDFLEEHAGPLRNRAGALLDARKKRVARGLSPDPVDNLAFWTYDNETKEVDSKLLKRYAEYDLDPETVENKQRRLQVLQNIKTKADLFILDYLAGIKPLPINLILELFASYPHILGDDDRATQAVLDRLLFGRTLRDMFGFYYRVPSSFQKLFPLGVQKRLNQVHDAVLDAMGKDPTKDVVAFF